MVTTEAPPLHATAYSDSGDAVRLLLDRGANLEARDTTLNSTPLVRAAVGNGEQPQNNPNPDWLATVQAPLDRGGAIDEVSLSTDDPHT